MIQLREALGSIYCKRILNYDTMIVEGRFNETIRLLNKYAELTEARMDKQVKLDKYVQQWLDGETQMSAEGVQQLVDSATQQIEQLKASANQAQSDYLRIAQEEIMKRNAVRSVRYNLGTSPEGNYTDDTCRQLEYNINNKVIY